ncbi:hypothetical protein [Candidatus Stoquefichus massiliensis]|uniref:hypothetical protein n=1 Tax=Candidatus Stoquefichus massiliensis TaxID=1470350 RepID=UPI0004B6DE3C|nr:hypothetical protein [Candidatus Stoquefichus massiliensis]
MSLTISMQKYLITIYLLSLQNSHVHQIDIAISLGYSKASVYRAIQLLLQAHYISITTHNISLTPLGQQTVNHFINEYQFFYKLLIQHEFSHYEAQNYALKLMNAVDQTFIQKIHSYHEKIGIHLL